MENRKLGELLSLRELVLPSSQGLLMVNDIIPLLAAIKRDLEEVKARLSRIEERLGITK